MEIIRDLGRRYGSHGSVLVRRGTEYFVVSSTDTPLGQQTLAFPATAGGRVTSWGEVCGDTGMTREQVIAELEAGDGLRLRLAGCTCTPGRLSGHAKPCRWA